MWSHPTLAMMLALLAIVSFVQAGCDASILYTAEVEAPPQRAFPMQMSWPLFIEHALGLPYVSFSYALSAQKNAEA